MEGSPTMRCVSSDGFSDEQAASPSDSKKRICNLKARIEIALKIECHFQKSSGYLEFESVA